jgi:GDP-4-dehydro-6-deoxy-D-mannose reductase
MTILVTGASGFAGSHLIEALLANPQYAHADIHGTCYGNAGFLETILPKNTIHAIDLTDQKATEALIQTVQPDWIFHLAAFAAVGKSYDDIPKVLQNNLLVQTSMLESVRKHAPKARVLVVGSAEEYGWSEPGELPINEDHPLRPVNAYGVSKVAQDLLGYAYFKSFGLDIVRASI